MQGCILGGEWGICPLTKFLPLPCNIKPAQQISFVVKYLSENVPEVISESLKLNFYWGSMHPPSWPCAYTHGWGFAPLYFSKYLFCPPPPQNLATFLNAAMTCIIMIWDILLWINKYSFAVI